MRWSFVWWAFAGLAAAAGPAASQGLKIVTSESFPAGTKETTEYVAADRARVEWRLSSRTPDERVQEHRYVHIRRCDLDKLIVLDTGDRSYHTASLRGHLTFLERAALMLSRGDRGSQAGPEIIVETKTVDTGERRVAFGYRARRVVTVRRQFRATDPAAAEETVTDGWYIDLDTRSSCGRTDQGRGVLLAVAHPVEGRADAPSVVFKDVGQAEEGFPIDTIVTWSVAERRVLHQSASAVTRRVVTHLSRQPLDPTLFEVPPGFRSTDRIFTQFATSWHRQAFILRSVVASWFR